MNTSEKYKNLLVIVAGFLVLFWFFQWIGFLVIASIIAIIPFLIPITGILIVKGWLGLAQIIGRINARILLTLIFFGFLVPIAWVQRLFGQNPLLLENKNQASFFEARNHKFKKKDFENMW